jgi:phosphatidylglycerophosphate synthase
MGVKPNQVSVMSVVFAAGAAACLSFGVPSVWAWLGAAVCVQLRLVCNLMDGMLAVEGGLKSPSGDLYNEFPDRLADTFILAGLGMAGGTDLSGGLGWVAACGALITACVRMHGASLTGAHDFRGPMAKPHRMALVTGVCVLMAVCAGMGWVWRGGLNVVEWALGLMVAGIVVTLWRRLNGLSRALHERAKGVVK